MLPFSPPFLTPPPLPLPIHPVKGVNCCAELRGILNSGPDGGFCPPSGPCRGHVGDCGELRAQFAFVPVLPNFSTGLSGYTCRAFPDTGESGIAGNQRDIWIVALVTLAVGLPIVKGLASMFEMANDGDAPASFLSIFHSYGWRAPKTLSFALRRPHTTLWTYHTHPPGQLLRWHVRNGHSDCWAAVWYGLWQRALAFVTCAPTPWAAELAEKAAEEEKVAAAEEVEAAHARKAAASAAAGAAGAPNAAHPPTASAAAAAAGGRSFAPPPPQQQQPPPHAAAPLQPRAPAAPAPAAVPRRGAVTAAAAVAEAEAAEAAARLAASPHATHTHPSTVVGAFEADGAEKSAHKRRVTATAVALVLLVWAAMAWVIFTVRCPLFLNLTPPRP